jgi:hypothetical protein
LTADKSPDDTEAELEAIVETVGADGEAHQDHPIENPGDEPDASEEIDDDIAAPHPDEPGVAEEPAAD